MNATVLLEWFGVRVTATRGRFEHKIRGVARLDAPDADGHLAFCSMTGEAASKSMGESKASVILCGPDALAKSRPRTDDRMLIAVANPRLAFVEAADRFFPRSEVCRDRRRHAFVDLSADCDDSTVIGYAAVVGAGCSIAAHCSLASHVTLGRGVKVGVGCSIETGAAIGNDGFGYERGDDGRLLKFPHIGGTIIEDHVEIGANVTIDRGTLSDTRIGTGTKIDDGAYLAHNVVVRRHCLIMAHVILCGSCLVGDRVEISPGAVIRDGIQVGNDARIGLGAVVVKNVAPSELVAGVPAVPFRISGEL